MRAENGQQIGRRAAVVANSPTRDSRSVDEGVATTHRTNG